MKRAHQFQQLWRHFGPEWLAYRMLYAARLRSGLLRRRMPALDWQEQPLSRLVKDSKLAEPESYLEHRRRHSPAFFFAPSSLRRYQPYFAEWDKEAGTTPLSLADGLARGDYRYFEHTTLQLGFPPDWHANPFTGQAAPSDRHWSEIADFGHGDIKVIWEQNRFGFVYALARAYWRSGDDKYALLFWQLVESWRMKNRPQRGVNWKCGQETSFRLMAWCFGLYAFLESRATTADRVAALAQMIAVSGRRIESNLSYALSQRNNHGISEGVGLWTIGALFPELLAAERWRETGRQVLETLGRELIYEDGAFVQHSLNYQRLMLHDYLWALRLAELHGQPFSAELKERVCQSGLLLYQLQDDVSGRVPNYGQNDGALILPLSNCDYRDFRPVIQATHYSSTGARCYARGPWDEDLLWLFGPDALDAPVEAARRDDLHAEVGGYYTLRASDGFAFIRCASFRDRPGQADMLHVDLWWKGQNLALDPGTYSYNAAPPWDNALSRTAYHNTVTVDGLDQMEPVSKFVWLPWLRSRKRYYRKSTDGHLAYWEGEHDGYLRLKPPVSYRRALARLGDEAWVVLDALDSAGEHGYRLHWLFNDLPYEWDGESGGLTLRTPVAPYYVRIGTPDGSGIYSLTRADEHDPRGWHSPFYHYREPALSVDLASRASSLLFWTVFSAEPSSVILDGTVLSVKTGSLSAALNLERGQGVQRPLVNEVAVDGELEERLEIS